MHGILPANPPPDRPPVQVGAQGPSVSAAPDTGPGSFADYIRRQSQPSPRAREPESRTDRPPVHDAASQPRGADAAPQHAETRPPDYSAERGVKRDRLAPRDASDDHGQARKPAGPKKTPPEGETTPTERDPAAELVDPKLVSQLAEETGMSPAGKPRQSAELSPGETGLFKHAEAAAEKKQAQADAVSRSRGTDGDARAPGRAPGPEETTGNKAGATDSRTGLPQATGEDTGPFAENGPPRSELSAATSEEAGDSDSAAAAAAAAAAATNAAELTRSPDGQTTAAQAQAGRSGAGEALSRIRGERMSRKRPGVAETGEAGSAGPQKAGRKAVAEPASPASPVHEIEVNLSEQASRSGGESSGDAPRDGGSEGGEALSALIRSEGSAGSPPSAARSSLLEQAAQTLTRRLNGELGDSIVRQAKVMLRNAESAEIRLVIRPPELGRVRIQLQVENGHIAGRILVDNGNVRELMEQNLSALQRAFEEAGMELGDLDVSTGDARDERDAQQAANGRGAGGRPGAAGAESLEQSVTRISEYEPGRHRINLVA